MLSPSSLCSVPKGNKKLFHISVISIAALAGTIFVWLAPSYPALSANIITDNTKNPLSQTVSDNSKSYPSARMTNHTPHNFFPHLYFSFSTLDYKIPIGRHHVCFTII